MKTKHKEKALALLVVSLLLTACGGGGGGGGPSGPVTSTLSFPLQSAYKTAVVNGLSKTFTISGTCSGTGNSAAAPATTASTFETVAGFSAAESLTMSFTNCTSASIAQSETEYWDSNYVPLGDNTGVSSADANYGVYLTAPSIPTSVKVGGTGIIGTETFYTDSTKATGFGTSAISYVIEADTSTTAIVNFISNFYNTGNTLLWTEQNRYRIASTGGLTTVSKNVQYANGSTTHLVLTY
jgi:hypothetical protein